MTNTPRVITKRAGTIRLRIAAFDYVCSGTLLERTKVCGKPGCQCASNPAKRHGPYFEWSRREGGKLVHTVVSPEEARLLKEAIQAYRRIQSLLRQWERESIRAIRSRGG